MKKTMMIAVTSLALLAGPAFAQNTSPMAGQKTSPMAGDMKLSQAECQSLWNKLDPSQSGKVSQTAARSYVTDFGAVDTNKDSQLSKAEFEAGCNAGKIHDTASTGAGSGASSTQDGK